MTKNNELVPVSQTKGLDSWMIKKCNSEDLVRSFSGIYGTEIRRKDIPIIPIPKFDKSVKRPKWELKLVGQSFSLETLEGIIVGWPPVQRVFWKSGYTGNNSAPPDCMSRDGIRGVGNPGGECVRCPMNEWGSAREHIKNAVAGENRKACAERVHLYLWLPQVGRLPFLLDVPPSSIEAARNYRRDLFSAGFEPEEVFTRLTLEAGESGEYNVFQVEPSLAGGINDQEQLAVAKAYSEAIMQFIPSDVMDFVKDSPMPEYRGDDPLDETESPFEPMPEYRGDDHLDETEPPFEA